MFTNRMKSFGLIAGGMAAGLTVTALQGCDDGLGNIAEQCGLTCAAEGILEGNASISGVASVDAFFGAVVTFSRVSAEIAGGINAELRAIALSLELDPGASGAEIKAAIQAKLSAAIDGGLKVEYAPPRCEVSVEATIEATAKCDAEVQPGMATVECSGSCEADASVEASCDANAEVKCVGQAPQLKCEGSCQGTCRLEAAASCSGTCRGECSGECSVRDASGQCAGACDGMCQGSCELSAGGECGGSCEGECTYTPPSGMCDASASVRCEAKADAKVQCNGRCDGEVTPPKAKAECEASAKAEANASVQCFPPQLEITWQWSASLEGDVNAQAEFRAWLQGFRVRFAALLAAVKRAELVLKVGADLVAAGEGAVKTSINLAAEGDVDLKTGIGLGCAIQALGDVGTAVNEATGRLSGSVSAAAEVTTSIGG